MEFIFVLNEYDDAVFKSQVSKALEKRTELISRKEHPKLWMYTDKMNSKEKASEEVLKKRQIRYRIYGIVLMILGFFLSIPSLMEPKEMLIPLIVGTFTVCIGLLYFRHGRESKKKKLTSFDKAERKLFGEYEKIPNDKVSVTFTDDEVKLDENATIDY